MPAKVLYVTAPSEKAAEKLGEKLIAEHCAACVNILPRMRSIYRWEGKIEHGDECVVIVKTSAEAAPAARDLILSSHPYDEPCIIALDIDPNASAADFLAWVGAQTT